MCCGSLACAGTLLMARWRISGICGRRVADAALDLDSCIGLQSRLTICDNGLTRPEAFLNDSFARDRTDGNDRAWLYPLVRPHNIYERPRIAFHNRLGRNNGCARLLGKCKHNVDVNSRPKPILRICEYRS